ncbi:MAG: DNA primase [candidate division KSB1 bacterium]|nr:DNA primase [candidate division KSB1 bacterium]
MPIIPENIVEEVRMASDIVDVVSDYVALKQKGRNFFGLCPFHPEKTPSFSVNPEKQIFHCFGCGTGGNVFTFIMKEEGVNFPEAVRILAKRAGIAIPEPEEATDVNLQVREALYHINEMAMAFYEQQLFSPAGREALKYLHSRGFTDEGIRTFHLGYAPDSFDALLKHATARHFSPDKLEQAGLLNKREDGGYYDRFRHRVMFPILNLSGKVIAFGGRRLSDDDTIPKYVNSPETPIYHKSNVLYGLFLARDAIREQDLAVFVEGYTDMMRLYLSGIRNVVATSGTALTPLQARLVRRYTQNVTLLYDSDTAGAAATLRGADVLVEQGLEVKVAELQEGEDPDSFVQKYGPDALREQLAKAIPLLDFKALRIPEAGGHLEKNERVQSLVQTLAKIQDGLKRQEMVHYYAEKMKLDEEVLWDEVRRLRRLYRLRRKQPEEPVQVLLPAEQKGSFAERSRPVEEELIRIMLLYWDAVPFVFSFMEVTDFYNEDFQIIAAVLFELYKNQIRPEPEELIHYFRDAHISEFISRVVLLPKEEREAVTKNYQRWAADCLAKLQRLMLELKIEDVQQQIKEREASGGDVTELLEAWRNLQDQRQRIRPENFLPEYQ